MRARPLLLSLPLLGACALTACGARAHPLPTASVDEHAPRQHAVYKAVGLEIDLPEPATVAPRRPPGVFRSTLGPAYIAGFAYRRAEQLPRNAKELDAARTRLVAEIRKRERGFRLIRASSTRAAGARAVEVVGDQPLAGGTLRTRSVHVYKGVGEYVLDMLAPAADFAQMNRTFFSPAVGSLKVTGEVEQRGRT